MVCHFIVYLPSLTNGTHHYMFLPSFLHTYAQGYGREADLWSVGVIMFLLLCGKLPFDGEDHNEIIRSTIQVRTHSPCSCSCPCPCPFIHTFIAALLYGLTLHRSCAVGDSLFYLPAPLFSDCFSRRILKSTQQCGAS
jgi:serine/threonine protein kinase